MRAPEKLNSALPLGFAVAIILLIALYSLPRLREVTSEKFTQHSQQGKSVLLQEGFTSQFGDTRFGAQRTSDTLNISESCDSRGNENLVIIWVDTAPANVNKRNKIRTTWGSVRWHNDTRIRILFFLGAVEDAQQQSAIDAEIALHKDTIQDQSYIDTYRNLTRKGLSALGWIAAHCPSPFRVVKVDDDTLVNPDNLVHFLRNSDEAVLKKFICETSLAHPERSTFSKYYVPYEEFENDTWPIFCQGYGYIIPPGVVQQLLDAAKVVRLVSMEDVYITGILGQYIGISHNGLTSKHAIMTKGIESDFQKAVEEKKDLIFVGHAQYLTQYDVFWRLISTKQKMLSSD